MKPAFFKNEELAKLPFQWRLLYAGLWTQADRAGRLEARPERLKAELFPYDGLDVEEGLALLADGGFITRYDRDGGHYIAIPTFPKHQSPHIKEPESEIPPAPRHQTSPVQAPDKHQTSTGQARPVLGTSTSTSTSTGTGTALRARFDRFRQAYPKKVGEDGAWAVWKARKPDERLTVLILEAVERQKHSVEWQRDNGRFIPSPKKWLADGRWKDEITLDEPRGNNKTPRRGRLDPHQDHAQKTREVNRLVRDEGLTRAQANARVGYR